MCHRNKFEITRLCKTSVVVMIVNTHIMTVLPLLEACIKVKIAVTKVGVWLVNHTYLTNVLLLDAKRTSFLYTRPCFTIRQANTHSNSY